MIIRNAKSIPIHIPYKVSGLKLAVGETKEITKDDFDKMTHLLDQEVIEVIDYTDNKYKHVIYDEYTPGGIKDGPRHDEELTITALNTLSELSRVPVNPTNLTLIIDRFYHLHNGTEFTITDKLITFLPIVAGFDLNPGDAVKAIYE